MDWLDYSWMTLKTFTFITLDLKRTLVRKSVCNVISRFLAVGYEPYKKRAPPAGPDPHYSGVLRRVHRQLCCPLHIPLPTEVRGRSDCLPVTITSYGRCYESWINTVCWFAFFIFIFLCLFFLWIVFRKSKNQSSLVHRGLVVALFFLLVLFVLTGTVANSVPQNVCRVFGGLLHYALLSVLFWMAVEVTHTFWMMYMVFKPSPKPWIWYLLGFGTFTH